MKPTSDTPATPAPAPKTVTEQKADFTAEGSPPPGKVATTKPQTTPEPTGSQPKLPG